MATKGQSNRSQDATPDAVGVPATTGATSSNEYLTFILTQLSDLQRTVGAIQQAQAPLQNSIDKLDGKISEKLSTVERDVSSLIKTHHATKWVLIVLLSIGGVSLSVVGYVAKEVWDLSKPLIIQKLTVPQLTTPQTPVAPAKRP